MEKTNIIKEIIDLHRKVNRLLREYDTDVWMELTLTVPQLKSLFFIANQKKTSFRRLAERLKVTPSNMTGVIDRLVDQGLVSRTENPDDRRVILLQATEKGEALVSALREKRSSYLSQALIDLGQEDLISINQGLTVLARVTEEYSRRPAINPKPVIA
jgi:MarR family transcriptional regulator, organic hydroperoxide resistance regulator